MGKLPTPKLTPAGATLRLPKSRSVSAGVVAVMSK